MAEVAQVVLDEERESDVAAGCFPDVRRGAGIRMLHDVHQVPVVGQPEFHQIAPLAGGIILRAHPIVLLISGKHQAIFVLQTDETLMIVGRRIDEMPEDLFLRPGVLSGTARGSILADGEQAGTRVFERAIEFGGDIGGGHGDDDSRRRSGGRASYGKQAGA